MNLTALSGTVLIERLLVLESDAAHLTALAAVADACAHVAREKADAAQHTLSEVKIFLALLPAGTELELRAAKPASALPAERLGVRPRLPLQREEPEFASVAAEAKRPRIDEHEAVVAGDVPW